MLGRVLAIKMAHLEYHKVLKSHIPGSDIVFLQKSFFAPLALFSLDIDCKIAFAFSVIIG